MDSRYQDCTLLHVDADGFFAAVEQALDPTLRGRPVVTGAERGIIAAASYEAKALGIKRGLQLHEARARCPDLVVLPSDYEAYSLYSHRLFAILRRFTPHVEEYSIDEAFADLDGCGTVLGMPLEAVAAALRQTVAQELGLTVSVGISLTKTLAKLGSKFRKPDGQTLVRRDHVPLLLARTPIDKVWGIGPASAAKLRARGMATAAAFARMEAADVLRLLHKPGYDTWRELQGHRVLPLDTGLRQARLSLMKGHTFAPCSRDPLFLFSEALRNLGAAMAKLRRHRQWAREIGLCLRFEDYAGRADAAPVPLPTCLDSEAIPVLRLLFDRLFISGPAYRSTLVWLGGLLDAANGPRDLFGETPERRDRARLHETVDALNQRYGQHAVAPAALLEARRKPRHPRDATPRRYDRLMNGEGTRHLALPRLTPANPV
jgi:DNA polymerase IV